MEINQTTTNCHASLSISQVLKVMYSGKKMGIRFLGFKIQKGLLAILDFVNLHLLGTLETPCLLLYFYLPMAQTLLRMFQDI